MEDEKSSQSIWIINRRLRDDNVGPTYRETQKLLKDYQSNLESNAENTARPPKKHLIIVCLPFQWTVCRFQLWAIGRRSGDKNMDVWRLIGERRNDSTKRVQRVNNTRNFSFMFCPTEWINYKHRETRWSVCCRRFTSHQIMGRIDHRSRLQMALILTSKLSLQCHPGRIQINFVFVIVFAHYSDMCAQISSCLHAFSGSLERKQISRWFIFPVPKFLY